MPLAPRPSLRLPPSAFPLALLALALAVYLPALGAGFIWDDDVLTASPLVASWGGLRKMWVPPSLAPRETHFWPLVYSTFWLEYRLWGLHPFGYHLVNIMLHGLCGVLLWRVLRRLEAPGAWLAGALFVAHPVHAESVAWVIERKDVLSGALALAAALAFLKCGMNECGMRNAECGIQISESHNAQLATRHSPLATRHSPLATRHSPLATCHSPLATRHSPLATRHSPLATHSAFCALAFLLFAGALLSKSIVVGLPIALGAVIWWRRGRLGLRAAAALAGMLALAAALTVADMKFMNAHLAEPVASGLSWPQRVLVASRAVWTCLFKLAWPHPLAPFYPKWDVNPASVLAWLPLVAGLGVLGGLWAARRRIGRGPLAAAIVFVVILGPALGLVDHGFMGYSWVADRFQYLASAAPLALAAAILTSFRIPHSAFRISSAALLVVLGALCFQRAGLYKDSVTLYSAAARAYPQCWGAHYVRGFAMLERGDDSEEALKSLDAALRLHPDFMIATLMGQVQTALGKYPEAEASYQKALALKPDHGEAYNGYGVLLNATGRSAEAVVRFRKALELDRDNARAMAGLGVALKNQKKFEDALGYLAKAADREPDNAEFQKELGVTLSLLDRNAEAAAAFARALEIEPNDPDSHAALGYLALKQGRVPEAAGYFTRARALNPQAPQYDVELGRIYETLGQPAEAARRYREALRLDPANAAASERLKALNSGTVY